MIVKICKKHGQLRETQVRKEKNNNMKAGFQLRCLQCRQDKDRLWKFKNPDKHKESASRARNEARRLYREGLSNVRPRADIWAGEDRKRNPEKYREWSSTSRKRLGQLRNTREVCRRLDFDVDDYYRMLKEQEGKCAICSLEETRKSRTEGKICALSIDHCHYCEEKGKHVIRGLLCHACNTALGKMRDNIGLIKNMIAYVENHVHVDQDQTSRTDNIVEIAK